MARFHFTWDKMPHYKPRHVSHQGDRNASRHLHMSQQLSFLHFSFIISSILISISARVQVRKLSQASLSITWIPISATRYYYTVVSGTDELKYFLLLHQSTDRGVKFESVEWTGKTNKYWLKYNCLLAKHTWFNLQVNFNIGKRKNNLAKLPCKSIHNPMHIFLHFVRL